ncbi:MAG: CehA/McbA family metallohydrolase [Thermoplasmata archaeon]
MDRIRLDLHVHSRSSPDSTLTLGAIADQLGLAGLQGFALTDHNTVLGHAALRELNRQYPRLWFLPGIEVSTQEGHLLVYGLAELPPIYRPLADTLDWVRDRGGIPVLAHPLRWSHGVGRRLAARAPVAAIESVNGHNSTLANARAEVIAARRGIGSTGGSDAHELSDLGRAFTEFPGEVDSLDDILEALRRGRVTGAGDSLTGWGRARLAFRTTRRRLGRGLRPI